MPAETTMIATNTPKKKRKYKDQPPLYAREQYYIKRDEEYYPVNDPVAYDGLGSGAWLVIVKPGSTSCRNKVDTNHIEIDASLQYLHDGLCKAMAEKSKLRPKSVRMSPKEIRAWKAYEKIMGKDIPMYFEYASHSEIADSACDYVKKVLIENDCDMDKIREKCKFKKSSTNVVSGMDVE